jgi:hypothetical protein
MLRLTGGDRLILAGGVLGLGGVRGRPTGDLILGGVLDLDLRCLLIGLWLKYHKKVENFEHEKKKDENLPRSM